MLRAHKKTMDNTPIDNNLFMIDALAMRAQQKNTVMPNKYLQIQKVFKVRMLTGQQVQISFPPFFELEIIA